MSIYADLHIHSKYSRATSRESDLEHLARWARVKGLTVIGTGDFTHPAWRAEIRAKLDPAEPGLFRLKPALEKALGPGPRPPGPVRFMLTVEISTIYKKDGATRKVHHLILVPDFDSADRLVKSLTKIGNLLSDGRPILGLDSRNLLEITLESGLGSYLIPAHIWTPWFSALGSKSGFDSISDCYGDLADHVFAAETGLSSDPAMNWRVSALDRYRLVSNSDAHSPGKLGREACVFETDLDYFAMRQALETGAGYGGTIEFFPEEGKYHLDGHRKCGTRMGPEETRRTNGRCPVCGKPVTVGVMSRVQDLADRPEGARPEGAAGFRSLIPLGEVIAETQGCGANTKGAVKSYEALIERLGPELYILERAPLEDVRRAGSEALAEALSRMRSGRVIREAGYDGEYGVIKLFAPGELGGKGASGRLFELAENERLPRTEDRPQPPNPSDPEPLSRERPSPSRRVSDNDPSRPDNLEPRSGPAGQSNMGGLDPDQAAAASITRGALLIVAGPGTGKTRTLTHRIARLITKERIAPEQCLALTFTRRAAAEMEDRLEKLLPRQTGRVPVMTFHGLGYLILQEHGHRLGLARRVRVIGEAERMKLIKTIAGTSAVRKLKKIAAEISRLQRRGLRPGPDHEYASVFTAYTDRMRSQGLIDFDDLIARPVELLDSEPGVLARCRERWPYVSIDEYQDVDAMQYRLIKLLCPEGGNICAIGDPDQAIYGFRGADVSFFLRFAEDYPGAKVVRLGRNYRSSRAIVEASLQMVSPASLADGSGLEALFSDPARITVYEAATDKAEAEFVVHTIERWIGGTTFFSMDSGRVDSGAGGDYTFGDFAALYRTEAQSELLVEALARSGIPFQRRSHRWLGDDERAAQLMEALRERASAGSVEEALREIAGAREAGVFDEALEILLPLARRCGDDWPRFFGEAVLSAEIDEYDPRAEAVSLLTLHAAKGLEFRAVFIVGCEDGIIPLSFGGTETADLAEERRIFFVGMTRARERLLLSYARKRRWQGKVRDREVSPFLRDIEEELLARDQTRHHKKSSARTTAQLKLFSD